MDSENLTSGDTAHEPSMADGPGARLRAARQELRLDLAHVAADTRIPLRHLEAIEGDNYEALPSRAYAIGFSRTFAQAVGLDPAEITDMVRAELADGSMRRALPSPGIEPGDPARLPSSGLAWAMGAAVLVLAIGVFAFYRSYFGAGTEPGSLLEPAASETPAVAAAAAATPAPTPAANGPVVLTALEDGVWLRLYEEGGERLFERALKQGETVTVPPTASDPRINTGRPYALSVSVGGQEVPKLSDRPETISGVPVSAAALLARAAVTPAASASGTPQPGGAVPLSAPAPARRRNVVPQPAPTTTTTVPEAASASEPEAGAETAPSPQA